MKVIDKKKRRGFTLIELLAVIVVLGVVISIVIVVFSGSKDEAKVKLATVNKENILKSSAYYTDEYSSTLVWSDSGSDTKACIPVKELINKGYFKEPEVEASGYLNNSVLVTKSENKVNNYEFSTDTNCGIVDTSVDLVLKGDNPLIKEYGTDYDLWSDVDIVLSNSMVEVKSISIDNSECNNTKSLEVGEYVAHYSVTTYGGASKTLDRNVKIVDTKAPVISFVTPIVKGVGEDFALDSDVTYEDEAKYKDGEAIVSDSKRITLDGTDIANTKGLKVGNYVIRYEVSDRSGNIASRDREVSIITSKWEFDYVGYEEEFVAPMDGYYYVDAKGASNLYRYIYTVSGGEVTGYIYLNKGDKLVVNVGGSNGYNGGGRTDYDGSSYYGGGATTLRSGSKNLITAAGAGHQGIFCAYDSQYEPITNGGGKYNFNIIANTCVPYNYERSIGGSGDGTGGSDQGNGAGGNGTNGGGGSLSIGDMNVSKACTKYEYKENIQKYCVAYGETCTKIPGMAPICYLDPNKCTQYTEIKTTTPVCIQYTYTGHSISESGSGGANKVDSSVKNANMINGGGYSNDGHLSIKFVGDSYE